MGLAVLRMVSLHLLSQANVSWVVSGTHICIHCTGSYWQLSAPDLDPGLCIYDQCHDHDLRTLKLELYVLAQGKCILHKHCSESAGCNQMQETALHHKLFAPSRISSKRYHPLSHLPSAGPLEQLELSFAHTIL